MCTDVAHPQLTTILVYVRDLRLSIFQDFLQCFPLSKSKRIKEANRRKSARKSFNLRKRLYQNRDTQSCELFVNDDDLCTLIVQHVVRTFKEVAMRLLVEGAKAAAEPAVMARMAVVNFMVLVVVVVLVRFVKRIRAQKIFDTYVSRSRACVAKLVFNLGARTPGGGSHVEAESRRVAKHEQKSAS